MERVSVIQNLLHTHNAQAALLTFLPDIRWCTGFSGSNALVVCTPDDAFFITDGRYTAQSKTEVHGADIFIAEHGLVQCMVSHQLGTSARTILVQGDHLTLSEFETLRKSLPDAEFVPVSGLLESYVAVKNKEETRRIVQAQEVTDAVFNHILDVLKPGVTEQEIAAEIVYQHLRRGASAMSFDPIVASGPNSALPHARPTERTLQQGDMVVIDMGCFIGGYASDMTRTVAIGQPSEEARQVYELVLQAQERALSVASVRLSSQELDRVARSVIEEGGYGEYFTHSLGHGVGLQIHEWPSISWRTNVPLVPGIVITIEPGVYLPGRFGVRIEDMIQLTESGCDNLTATTKELIVL